MTSHVDTQQPREQHQCSSCDKTCTTKSGLNKHMKIHTEEKSYACGECGAFSLRKHDRDQHYKVHLGLKPFACDQCGSCFTRDSSVTRHKESGTACKQKSLPPPPFIVRSNAPAEKPADGTSPNMPFGWTSVE